MFDAKSAEFCCSCLCAGDNWGISGSEATSGWPALVVSTPFAGGFWPLGICVSVRKTSKTDVSLDEETELLLFLDERLLDRSLQGFLEGGSSILLTKKCQSTVVQFAQIWQGSLIVQERQYIHKLCLSPPGINSLQLLQGRLLGIMTNNGFERCYCAIIGGQSVENSVSKN